MNPDPIKLEFEKVYHPCALLSKKRYVGLMYENMNDILTNNGKLDAKGIETIRRDSCPIVSETMQHVINMLFNIHDPDLTKVKKYLYNTWHKILTNQISLKKFIFSKEVRMGTYTNLPPAAIVAKKRMSVDPRTAPLYAERVNYIVVNGKPGARLIDMVIDPIVYMQDQYKYNHNQCGNALSVMNGSGNNRYSINGMYYITKQINAAIGRVLELIEVDINQWFQSMPRKYSKHNDNNMLNMFNLNKFGQRKKCTIDSFYVSKHCIICHALTKHRYFCQNCRSNTQYLYLYVYGKEKENVEQFDKYKKICQSCMKHRNRLNVRDCISLDCPLLFDSYQALKKMMFYSQLSRLVSKE